MKEKQGRELLSNDHIFSEIEKKRRRGFDTTIAQVEWLLVVVILFYAVIPDALLTDRSGVVCVMLAFTGVVLVFHYSGLQKYAGRWKTWLEALIMTGVVSYVVWHSGRIVSPLLSLYLLVIIVSATTLGLKPTLLHAAVITVIYMFMAFAPATITSLGISQARLHLLQLFPFWLVAYLAAMLAYEAEASQFKLAELAHTDTLTQLWNMRMFSDFAEQEFERAFRYKRPFSVMMLDADNLKCVNDRFGHQVGSQLIQIMGKKIRTHLRGSDVVARYGGDEFIVLLPETVASEALVTAERVRRCLEESLLDTGSEGGPVFIRTSIGIASYPEHDDNLSGVMRKADMALYCSKESGKNRCSVYVGGQFS
ncbi:MAG: diguanylate cyclase [Deltaproteobacteria bacterium]|nr:diguanylate cyclase [Deltaproteobacteria bacterium]